MFGSHFQRLAAGIAIAGLVAMAGAALAADPLTIEQIWGKPPLLTPLPTPTWVGDSKGVSLSHDVTGQDGKKHPAFVIRDVPSGREYVIARLDQIPVPDDLKKDNPKFEIED
ncbi:MAG TPA: hypothetical protein VFH88_02095, partial [Candidatus Krumholzibacteria bacterium]|nr:hypothetical protein [Candidatus Krumholzibacteria bacterium]